MFKYKVRNMEPFKDGNILQGRFLKPGEILTVTEVEKHQIEQSGGLLEVLETLVPNPLKSGSEDVKTIVQLGESLHPLKIAVEDKSEYFDGTPGNVQVGDEVVTGAVVLSKPEVPVEVKVGEVETSLDKPFVVKHKAPKRKAKKNAG